MPTISDPKHPAHDERIARIVNDFIEGIDTVKVMTARLFGAGLRLGDLTSWVNFALDGRAEKVAVAKTQPCRVQILMRNGKSHTLRFNNEHSAGCAVEILRRQPDVLFACRTYR